MFRASGRASAKTKYTEVSEDDEDEEDFEDEVPLKARKQAKQAKGRAAAVSKEREPEVKRMLIFQVHIKLKPSPFKFAPDISLCETVYLL